MKLDIKHRDTGAVIYTAEIDANEATPEPIRLGMAVQAALAADANLVGADLTRANLSGADLTRANLSGTDLTRANLAGTDLTRANLSDADLARANLAGADLTRANLAGTDLTRANLAGTDLARANLVGADLAGADLTRANLTRADLSGTDLAGADLTRANLAGTCINPPSAWAWAQTNAIHVIAIEGRTLILARRTRTSQHVGSQDYSKPSVYRAAAWSSDVTTECHPGLYLAGKEGEILCAAWLDEGVALPKGLRVRRFRKLAAETDTEGIAEVATWGENALDAEGVAVKGWTEQETA